MIRSALPERSASQSHRGRRPENQDAVLVTTLHDGSELAAVADGMGGQSAGEVASRTALEALLEQVESGASLAEAVRAANGAVFRQARGREEWAGMGTTLVALLRRGPRYEIVNVGDSRAYRLDAGGFAQVTEDHSFVTEAIRTGRLSPEDAARSPWRNALTRSIGTDPEVEVDAFGPFDSTEPHLVLLCTDGLHKVLGPEDLAGALRNAGEDLGRAATLLATEAYERGSDDNITVALLRFDGSSMRSGLAEPETSDMDSALEALYRSARAPSRAEAASAADTAGVARAAPESRAAAAGPGAGSRGASAPPPPRAAAAMAVGRNSMRRRKRRKRHRRKLPARWTTTELVVVGLVLLAVLVYVGVLGLAG